MLKTTNNRRRARLPEAPPPEAAPVEPAHTGTVLRAVSGYYDVQPDGETSQVRCRLRDRLRKELVLTESKSRPQRVRQVRRLGVTEPVVAGDRVRYRPVRTAGTAVPEGVIEEVLPRRREIGRAHV
jgi:putative ribosome biogenesis GTPase RsgA